MEARALKGARARADAPMGAEAAHAARALGRALVRSREEAFAVDAPGPLVDAVFSGGEGAIVALLHSASDEGLDALATAAARAWTAIAPRLRPAVRSDLWRLALCAMRPSEAAGHLQAGRGADGFAARSAAERLGAAAAMFRALPRHADPAAELCELCTLYMFVRADEADLAGRCAATYPFALGMSQACLREPGIAEEYRSLMQALARRAVGVADVAVVVDILRWHAGDVPAYLPMPASADGLSGAVEMLCGFLSTCVYTVQGSSTRNALMVEARREFVAWAVENHAVLPQEDTSRAMQLVLAYGGAMGSAVACAEELETMHGVALKTPRCRLRRVIASAVAELINQNALKRLRVDVNSHCARYCAAEQGQRGGDVTDCKKATRAAWALYSMFHTYASHETGAFTSYARNLGRVVSMQMRDIRAVLAKWSAQEGIAELANHMDREPSVQFPR